MGLAKNADDTLNSTAYERIYSAEPRGTGQAECLMEKSILGFFRYVLRTDTGSGLISFVYEWVLR